MDSSDENQSLALIATYQILSLQRLHCFHSKNPILCFIYTMKSEDTPKLTMSINCALALFGKLQLLICRIAIELKGIDKYISK